MTSCSSTILQPKAGSTKSSSIVPKTLSPTLSTLLAKPTPYRQPIATQFPKPTYIPTLDNSHITFIPRVIHVCPNNPFVPLENLGLPPEMRVVLLPAEFELHTPVRVGFWLGSSQDKEPQAITEVAPGEGMTNNEYQISPDGRWVSFLRQRKDAAYASLWVSSLNGRKLWPVKQIAKDSYSLWVTQQEIVIAEAENNYETLLSINPFNLKEERYSPLPIKGSDWYYYYQFRKDGIFYTLYVDSLVDGYTYILFDHSINTSWKVFQWIAPSLYPDTGIWLLADSTFLATVQRPYGIDISPKLDLNAIRENHLYDEIMRQVKLPEEILPVDVWQLSPETGTAILVEKNINIDLPTTAVEYLLDTENMTLRYYCTKSDQGIDGRFASISPDSRFAELVYEGGSGAVQSVGILNLETGYIALIKGYQMLGWGIEDGTYRDIK
jgi:hypothetical protein